jgi:leader peptidase (prepilin peptidase)/N-methyltransferase
MFMGSSTIFNPEYWSRVPFHFWSVVFFVLGSLIGSFLNVCIHRLPRGESIVFPPSHCPHCGYSIPWYLNIPLVTWPWLGGKCANCGAPISVRYFLIELLTAVIFLACWLGFGHASALLALAYCFFFAVLIAASFIDIEHFIIPDSLNFGGMIAGLACSIAVPALHHTMSRSTAFGQSLLGLAFGAGLVYLVVRGGKLVLGRRTFQLGADESVIFTESAIILPNEEIPYEEIFYRKADAVLLHAATVELCDRCYRDVPIKLTSSKLWIGDEELDPEAVPFMQVRTAQLIVPREVMGLGDVKFMALIGAFLGWQGVVFSLGVSSFIGAPFGLLLVALKRHDKARPMQYGPFIALAATIWIFGGRILWRRLMGW